MSPRTAKSFCRICAGNCALLLTIEDDRVIGARGDKSNPQTGGYACIKGLFLHEAHNSPNRLLHPLKRGGDGMFHRIPLEQALDEIAASVGQLIEAHGADCIGAFRGTMNYSNLSANHMLPDWLRALGSSSFYSTMTIDQSAKWVTFERLGGWAAGHDPYELSDVLLLVGTNPLVSLSTFNCVLQDPLKALKSFRARGGKLIVIDPRRTETARHADVFLQPRAGEDPCLMAGLLRIILERGWHDQAFCRDFVAGLEGLRAAVDPFTPDYVAQRADVPESDLLRAAETFAADGKRGSAASGTGPNMAAHSNLAEHLIECLNVVCGRYARPGDPVPNPGVLSPRIPRRAEVIAPGRSWMSSPARSASGFGVLFGQKMTGALADDIAADSPGKIRALFVDGGNPALALPNQNKIVGALKQLPLLVTIDPFMSATARLSHYILPPKMMFERADLPSRDYESIILFRPYSQYAAPLVPAPPGSELVDDWYPFWAIAKRLGRQILYDGEPLNMEQAPLTTDLLAILARHAAIPLAEIQARDGGDIFAAEPQFVEPGERNSRFDVMPDDVQRELQDYLGEGRAALGAQTPSTYRLIVRRMREVQNTMYHELPQIRRRVKQNPALLHPLELAALGLRDGDEITLVSAHGQIRTIVGADDSLRRDVVSLTHGWGGLPDDPSTDTAGACSNQLTSDAIRDPINAMPVFTGFSVRIEKRAPVDTGALL
jgi:anaerobic selenocysteine-containing dehydrogenase